MNDTKNNETQKLWKQRFIDRTHDAELYRIGNDADPKLSAKIFYREWHEHADYERAENMSKTWVIWLGHETMTDSVMLEKYR